MKNDLNGSWRLFRRNKSSFNPLVYTTPDYTQIAIKRSVQKWRRLIQTFFDFQHRQYTVLSPRSSISIISATFSLSFRTVLFTQSSSGFLGGLELEGRRAETTRYTTTEVVTTNGTSCTHSLLDSLVNPPNVDGTGKDFR